MRASRLLRLEVARPFQRLVQCSLLPNAGELLRADFETTFKGTLADAKDPSNFLHKYVVKADEVVPYTTTMMRVFTDLGALEDMRLIFAMAINELHQSVPEELYRIYLFSISETDTFTRDEVFNVLSLVQNTGVKLSLNSKLCILDLLLKLGLDPIEHVGAIAAEYNGPIPEEDVELLLKKCDSLLNTVLLTHYSAHWATEMFNLCAKFQIAVAERVVHRMFKMCVNEPSVHPIHIIKGAWVILSNPKAATSRLSISDEDIARALVRCRQWRSLEAVRSLQKLLTIYGKLENAETKQSFAVVAMHILSEQGLIVDAIKLMPLLEGSHFAAYSPYPCVVHNGTVVAETHPAYFIANALAQQGTAAIDAAYYSITNSASEAGEGGEPSTDEPGSVDTSKSEAGASSTAPAAPSSLTAPMMDIILAACSIVKDETRALETFNVYKSCCLALTSESFLHVLNAMPLTNAVQWQRPAVAKMIAANVSPTHETLRVMLAQSLEADDIENALWVVKLNRIYNRPLDRLLVVKLLVKITAGRDTEAAAFVVKVIDDTNTNVDTRVLVNFKREFSL